MLALFCSERSLGSLTLKAHDPAQELKSARNDCSGFHSSVERELRTVQITGGRSIILCPPRTIKNMHILLEFKAPLADGRLLLVSPFKPYQERATKVTSHYRNRLVATLTERVFIAYADAGGSVEALAKEVIKHRTEG